MANLLLDIIHRLQQAELVQGDGQDTYRDKMPDTPDEAICLVEYPGTPIRNTSLALRSIQISVRASSYARSRQRAYDLYHFLHKPEDPIFDEDSTGRWFTGTARQTPFKLSEDTKGRTTFAFNYAITTQTK